MTGGPGTGSLTRTQLLVLFLALTAAIATGLAIFTSVAAVIALIKAASSGLFLPILLSLIAAFLLEPLVRLLERGEMSRTASIFIVYALVTLVAAGVVRWLLPHWEELWASLQTDLPRYLGLLTDFVRSAEAELQGYFPFLQDYDLAARARGMAEARVAAVLAAVPRAALGIGGLFLVVPLFTFFFLRDGNKIVRACVALVPNRYFEMVHDLSYLVSRQMAQFIRGRIVEAAIVGMVVAIGLSFTDIRYAPLLGLFAGVTNLIPYLGPLIGMIPGLLIALVDIGIGPQFWCIFAIYFLIAQVIVDNFILIPILISRVSDLHPLLVLLAIIMGGKLYGVLGMIIGVPVVSIIKIAVLEIHLYRRAFALPETFEAERLT
jgi:putative permease